MAFDILKILEEEGYIHEGENNLIDAEKAFFAARVIKWIKGQAQSEPDFDIQSYLTMLHYYKTDMADLKFSEDGSTILYKMKHNDNDKEVQELVDSLIKSTRKTISEETKTDAEEIAEPTSGEDPADS